MLFTLMALALIGSITDPSVISVLSDVWSLWRAFPAVFKLFTGSLAGHRTEHSRTLHGASQSDVLLIPFSIDITASLQTIRTLSDEADSCIFEAEPGVRSTSDKLYDGLT